MEKKIVEKLTDWKTVAKEIVALVDSSSDTARVVALTGDLGSGKTTLVQHIAVLLGITEPITSPTFTILKRYEAQHPTFTNLIHMDAYRIESEAELVPLQFATLLLEPRTLFCIEWAEKVKTALPENTVYFKLEINQEKQHTIQRVS